MTSYLRKYGLGLPSTSVAVAHSEQATTQVRGAVLHVSAPAAAQFIGVSSGVSTRAVTPAPGVPDLVAIVYEGPAPTATAAAAPLYAASAPRGLRHPGEWGLGPWRPSWTPAEHADGVRSIRQAIGRGDVYQVNLVGHASAPYRGDPGPALSRITGLPGARYPYLVGGDGWAIACASPETLVTVADGWVETRPIKGTRPATRAGRSDLLSSAKERAEHIMIVDLERNDLAHVADIGTVVVPELFAVRRWCDLWQAESRVVARLREGVDLAGLLRAVLPGGSVTGAPKFAALAQIAALEPVGRGPSMGALGWLDHDRLELGLTIRTVAVADGLVHRWAGGGITWDSDPDEEVAEAAAKAGPLIAALTKA